MLRRRQEIQELQQRAAALIEAFEQSASTSVKQAQVRQQLLLLLLQVVWCLNQQLQVLVYIKLLICMCSYPTCAVSPVVLSSGFVYAR